MKTQRESARRASTRSCPLPRREPRHCGEARCQLACIDQHGKRSLNFPSRHRRIVFNQISQLMIMENPGLAQLLTVPTSWDKTRAPHLPPIASQLSAPLKEAASQRGKVPPKKSPPPIASQLSAPLQETASQRGKVPPKKSPPVGDFSPLENEPNQIQGFSPPVRGGRIFYKSPPRGGAARAVGYQKDNRLPTRKKLNREGGRV